MADPTTSFQCARYRCTLTMATCASRQKALMKNGKPVYPTCGSGQCKQGKKVLVQLGKGFQPAPYKQMRSNIKSTLVKIRKARAAEAAEAKERAARLSTP